ncbi:MAG TPA: M13 family metallopeptidase [Gemmatimonadaceae bacterium]
MKVLSATAFTAALLSIAALPAGSQQSVRPPIKLADLDTTVNACVDFYQYAGGGWLKANPVPAAFSSWSPFNELRESNFLVLKDVLESAAKVAKTTSDPDTKKLGTFYASCMDSAGAEVAGAKPLEAELARIAAISNAKQLNEAIAYFHAAGISPLFTFGTGQDSKNSSLVILSANQGGLGLPNRDYYTKTDSNSVKIRKAYVEHIAKTLQLTGKPAAEANKAAERVMALETTLAGSMKTPVELRDPVANYNLMTITAVNELTPAFDWNAFLGSLGVRGVTTIDIGQPNYFKGLNAALTTIPLEDWKSYLTWRLTGRASPHLSSAFVNQDFAFQAMLTGARQMQPRWRRCLSVADGVLGDALGKEYVKVAFTPEAKKKALEMIDNLRAVMQERIQKAEWMSSTTKQQALTKLSSFNQKIGYPDVWRDYSDLKVVEGPWAANILNSRAFAVRRDLAKLGKPVDRGEWFMTPPTVNAYFAPQLNEIAFPAGRLQPPFFHASYDEGANYGGVGGTIGHELSHGFDDQGRQYDSKGNLLDWWTEQDAKNYLERAKVVEDQYNAYTVLDSLHVNGKLTLGENLADVVGVSAAYDALQRALAGKPRTLIDGFTPEQRFFLAYAQARRGNSRDEALRLQIRTDPHSPGRFRVNGPLSNMPEFARAFGCKEGDPMVRSASMRARIW